MSDDYLWDRSGPPDPDVERLESMLGRLRSTPPVPELPGMDQSGRPALAGPAWTLRSIAPMLAAAAAVVLMIAGAWQSTRTTASCEVARLDGRPRIGSTALAGTGRIAVGQ